MSFTNAEPAIDNTQDGSKQESTGGYEKEMKRLSKYGVSVNVPEQYANNAEFADRAGKYLRGLHRTVVKIEGYGKAKKERTPAQKAATEKMRQARMSASRSTGKKPIPKFGAQ